LCISDNPISFKNVTQFPSQICLYVLGSSFSFFNGVVPEWFLPLDISIGKPTDQSSDPIESENSNFIFVSGVKPWWKMDLQGSFFVRKIRINRDYIPVSPDETFRRGSLGEFTVDLYLYSCSGPLGFHGEYTLSDDDDVSIFDILLEKPELTQPYGCIKVTRQEEETTTLSFHKIEVEEGLSGQAYYSYNFPIGKYWSSMKYIAFVQIVDSDDFDITQNYFGGYFHNITFTNTVGTLEVSSEPSISTNVSSIPSLKPSSSSEPSVSTFRSSEPSFVSSSSSVSSFQPSGSSEPSVSTNARSEPSFVPSSHETSTVPSNNPSTSSDIPSSSMDPTFGTIDIP
jgi:hypothetical protein